MRLSEPFQLSRSQRALLTILDEEPLPQLDEDSLLSSPGPPRRRHDAPATTLHVAALRSHQVAPDARTPPGPFPGALPDEQASRGKCLAYGWSWSLSCEGGYVIERRVLAAGHGALELGACLGLPHGMWSVPGGERLGLHEDGLRNRAAAGNLWAESHPPTHGSPRCSIAVPS